MKTIKIMMLVAVAMLAVACKHAQPVADADELMPAVGPAFNSDSAYVFCQKQCDFGPRTMNSEAHDRCRDWIKAEFERFGCIVNLQTADLKGYDGTMLHASNIIASTHPERTNRIMFCAHYDSRPWADSDPDEANHHTPVMAANDGASGVAVMLEAARLLQAADSVKVGVDFICFDAEDYGTPTWYDGEVQVEDPWALGAQYWAQSVADGGHKYRPRYGVLLDMVGGEGAQFYQEQGSQQMAREVVDLVWKAAHSCDAGHLFPEQTGGGVTDDHVPVNQVAKIPCADIIPYYPNADTASFGPTWHTINDTMDHISRETLKAVGQTVIQLIYSAE